VKFVLGQSDIDLARNRTRGISVRLSGKVLDPLPARGLREVPAASYELPSQVLSVEGGGRIAMDPANPGKTLQPVFHAEVVLPSTIDALDFIGRRAWLRLDHGAEPLVWRLYRGLRQVLLREFNF
jgi:putative peptide zinc metalloprotease protein